MLRGALALALLAVAPAAAEPFPSEGDRWQLDVRAPGPPGSARFARVVAEPTHGSRWAIDVTCGLVSTRTGRETVKTKGEGFAARARSGYLGGTFVTQGRPTSGFAVDQPNDELDVLAVTFGPGCPSGPGSLSSGD
jgi:hypothetical protein